MKYLFLFFQVAHGFISFTVKNRYSGETTAVLCPIGSCSSLRPRAISTSPHWWKGSIILGAKQKGSESKEGRDKGEGEGKGGGDESTGMEEAFASLEELKSLDWGVEQRPVKSSEALTFNTNINIDDSFKMKNDGDLTEDEIRLYKDMYQELEGGYGEDIYEDVLGTLLTESNASSSQSRPSPSNVDVPLEDADGIGSIYADANSASEKIIDINAINQLKDVEVSENTDLFMQKALEEALDEAKIQAKLSNNNVDDTILNDEELMKEISAVFDRANEKLLESIADIKREQDQLSKSNAENRSKVLEEEEVRLREAEGSVARLVEKVKRETLEVEKAVAELKQVQEKMGNDPLSKAAGLKKAGIVKQGALVGTILFSFRSIGELLLLSQQGGSGDIQGHSAAATIQALIALACGAYLVLF